MVFIILSPYASHPWGVQGYFYVIDSVAYKIVSELITVQMMFYLPNVLSKDLALSL